MVIKAIKDNLHIVIIVLLFVCAIVLSVHLAETNKEYDAKRKKETDSLKYERLEKAYEAYQIVHEQELMDIPEYANLKEEYEYLKGQFSSIEEDADMAENALDEIEQKGIDVSEVQEYLDNIIIKCKEGRQ